MLGLSSGLNAEGMMDMLPHEQDACLLTSDGNFIVGTQGSMIIEAWGMWHEIRREPMWTKREGKDN